MLVKVSAAGLCVLMAASGQRVDATDADDRRRAHIAVLTAINDLRQRAVVVAQTNAAPALTDALRAFGADSLAPLPDQMANDALQERARQAEQKARLLCPLVELACSVAPGAGDVADICQRALAICAVWIEPRDTGWSVQIDQDVLYPPSSDKDFTQGTQFEWTGRRTRGWFPRQLYSIVDYPAWKLLHEPKLGRPDGYEVNAFSFGFSAFTPRKGSPEECMDPRWVGNQVNESGAGCILAETDPIFDDRPYAGLLYFRTRRTTLSARASWTSDFTIGVLGTKIGHGVQQFIHRKVTSDVDPGGWSHQISDGGELTVKYRLAHRWQALDLRRDPESPASTWFDLTTTAEGNAGYYTNLSGSARARLGRIRSSPLTIERHAADPYRFQPAHGIRDVSPERTDWELYGWATYGLTRWRYNALLEGQFQKTDVTLSFDDGPNAMRKWVRDWQVGLTARRGRYMLTYNVFSKHSPLFDAPKPRGHSWGTLTFSIRPRLFATASS